MTTTRSKTISRARTKGELSGLPLWILEPKLFEAVLRIVSNHDLEKIILAENPRGWTEYTPEVEAMLPLLKSASSVVEVDRIIRKVFRQYFGSERRQRQTAAMAGEIWQCLCRPQHRHALARVVDLESTIKNVVKKLRQSHLRKDDRLRLALVAALKRQAHEIETERELYRLVGAGDHHLLRSC
jgi:metal-responsive CopG/Arc/MetJ family transcriptional regulator